MGHSDSSSSDGYEGGRYRSHCAARRRQEAVMPGCTKSAECCQGAQTSFPHPQTMLTTPKRLLGLHMGMPVAELETSPPPAQLRQALKATG